MYGYVSENKSTAASALHLDEGEEFEQLIAEYPEHSVYLFAGTDIDVALFVAPGVSAMLIEQRTSPDKSF